MTDGRPFRSALMESSRAERQADEARMTPEERLALFVRHQMAVTEWRRAAQQSFAENETKTRSP